VESQKTVRAGFIFGPIDSAQILLAIGNKQELADGRVDPLKK
jgi:hypothetical protein